MLSWADVLSPKGLVRRAQAWCPLCYEEWKRDGAVVYNPLLWSLEVVSRCPLHHTPLHQRCPHEGCNRLIPLLAPGSRPGYCSHCGRWLGCQCAKNPISAATLLDHDDTEWQHWVAARVAELIASVLHLHVWLQKDRFAEAVAAYLDGVAGSNVSAAARLLQVSKRTIRDWKNGVQMPQLSSLLRFCHLCGISPLHLFTGTRSTDGFGSTGRSASVVSGYKTGKHYRAFRVERLQRLLEATHSFPLSRYSYFILWLCPAFGI